MPETPKDTLSIVATVRTMLDVRDGDMLQDDILLVELIDTYKQAAQPEINDALQRLINIQSAVAECALNAATLPIDWAEFDKEHGINGQGV